MLYATHLNIFLSISIYIYIYHPFKYFNRFSNSWKTNLCNLSFFILKKSITCHTMLVILCLLRNWSELNCILMRWLLYSLIIPVFSESSIYLTNVMRIGKPHYRNYYNGQYKHQMTQMTVLFSDLTTNDSGNIEDTQVASPTCCIILLTFVFAFTMKCSDKKRNEFDLWTCVYFYFMLWCARESETMTVSHEYPHRNFHSRKIYQKNDGTFLGRTPKSWGMPNQLLFLVICTVLQTICLN